VRDKLCIGNWEKDTYLEIKIEDSPGKVTSRVERTPKTAKTKTIRDKVMNSTMTKRKKYNGHFRHVQIVIIRALWVS